MQDALFNLLLTVITTIITIIGGFLTNYLNEKIGSEKTKNYFEMSKQIVMSIEQFYPELQGVDKRKLALEKLLEFTNYKLTEEQASTLIESAVFELKKLNK